MAKWDWDEILAYQTLKVVRVKDARLGVIYYFLEIGIVVYIIVQLILSQGYLEKEPPVPGAIRVSLRAPSQLQTPAYCNAQQPCLYWSGNQILYPSDSSDSAFLTTRVIMSQYAPRPNCNFILSTSPSCIYEAQNATNVTSPMYIADIESYTLMIEHSIRGKATSLGLRNGLLDGVLKSRNGTVIATYKNSTNNPHVDGDIITVGDLLMASGTDLDSKSYAPGADRANNETQRSAGIVIVIVINYSNSPSNLDQITYEYLPQMIVGNEYKVLEVDDTSSANGAVTVLNRHGVFNFVSLLINLIAGLALMKVATTIVELLMLQLLPQRNHYKESKFEHTEDFSNLREQIKEQKRETEGQA
ncbi:hypothetical protein BC936DRAFT_140644 [Jimgerdemannia flammicorona]|uniref:Uncharacterized protein n=1 Tax=Jimgerdemannia flammicorona TaxID=994334 RepID=A0A433AHA6_9FUNG|nr:hypothetical protein BC936DRAFT_140644 [Jimgerdemannia flammicorona]